MKIDPMVGPQIELQINLSLFISKTYQLKVSRTKNQLNIIFVCFYNQIQSAETSFEPKNASAHGFWSPIFDLIHRFWRDLVF